MVKEIDGYKIVRVDGNRLCSYIVDGQGEVTYKVGSWVKAPLWLREEGYQLTFFETLNDALSYMSKVIWHYPSEFKIFKCKARKASKPKKPPANLAGISLGIITNNWICQNEWPEGTLMAEEIMLTEEIPYIIEDRGSNLFVKVNTEVKEK